MRTTAVFFCALLASVTVWMMVTDGPSAPTSLRSEDPDTRVSASPADVAVCNAPQSRSSVRSDVAGEAVADPLPVDLRIAGSLDAGRAPGYGPTWFVDAYRLTTDRTAVVERRRVFVEPRGRFRVPDLEPGVWQLASFTPEFRWGPVVEVDAESPFAEVCLQGGVSTGELVVAADLVATGGEVTVRAVRSLPLASKPLAVGIPIASRWMRRGESWRIADLAPGVYEVVVRPRDDGARDAVRHVVSLRDSVELLDADRARRLQRSTMLHDNAGVRAELSCSKPMN